MNHDRASGPSKASRRKRSAVACGKCHQRKVRCNVSQSGVPCSNCVHDGVVCKAPLPKGTQASLPRLLPRSSATLLTQGGHLARPLNPHGGITDSPGGPSTESGQSPSVSATKKTGSESPATADDVEVSTKARESGLVRYDATDDPSCDNAERISARESMIFFAGNEEGLEFMFDTCYPDRPVKSNHYIIPRPPPKGEFAHDSGLREPLLTSFPADDVLQELFRCYFQYVHPFLPIIDANEFLSDNNSPQRRSPLLQWSMLFVAASYIGSKALEKSGYKSRKAMKRAMYRQGKRLYDAEVEADRVVMIQSALLLSFWYADLEDRCGIWQWIGVAISVCQTIGMHRTPQGTPGGRHLHPHYRSWLWRRLFWSCYFRDVWVCLGLGRPMRINLDDCDTPMPTLNDLMEDIAGLLDAAGGKLLYDDCLALAKYWLNLLKLTMLLGGILANNYRPASKPMVHDIEKAELDILTNSQEAQNHGRQSNRLLTLHWCHLKAYYNTVIIALHRPFLSKSPVDLPEWRQETFYTTTLQKVKTAASSTTAILTELISFDLINCCHSNMVTAMMPAAQIHLHETKSPDMLTRQYASNQLDLHMTVLRELQNTYWTANMQYDLFSRARVATKTLPAAPAFVPYQDVSTTAEPLSTLGGNPLPVDYNNIMGTPWSPYLDTAMEVDLRSQHAGLAVDSTLDFFSPVPSMPVAITQDRVRQQNEQMHEHFG